MGKSWLSKKEEDDLSGRLFMHFQEKDGLNREKWVQLLHWSWGGVGSECPYSWCSRILQVSSAHLRRGLALCALQLDVSLLWFQQGSPLIISLVMAMDNLIFGMVKSMHLHPQSHGVLSVPPGWWSIRLPVWVNFSFSTPSGNCSGLQTGNSSFVNSVLCENGSIRTCFAMCVIYITC